MASSSAAPDKEMAQQIPFPDKFHLAAAFMDKYHPIETSTDLGDEHRLAFYSLHKQATQGPCNLPAPSRWYVTDRAKWQAWKDVGHFSPIEAMVFYVQLVEKAVDAQWWSKIDVSATSDASDVHSAVSAIASTAGANTTQPTQPQTPNWSPANAATASPSPNTTSQPAPPNQTAPTSTTPTHTPSVPSQPTPQAPAVPPAAVVSAPPPAGAQTHQQQPPTQQHPAPLPSPTPHATQPPAQQHIQQPTHTVGAPVAPTGVPPPMPSGGFGLTRTPPETLAECQALIRELWEKESAQTRRINDLEVVLQTLQTRLQHKQRECDTLRSHNVSLQSQLQFQQFPRPALPTPIRNLSDPHSPQRTGGAPMGAPSALPMNQPPPGGFHPHPQYPNYSGAQQNASQTPNAQHGGSAPPSPSARGASPGYGLTSPRTVHYYSAPPSQQNDSGLWSWVFPWRGRGQKDTEHVSL